MVAKELLTDEQKEYVGALAHIFTKEFNDIEKEYFGDVVRSNSQWVLKKRPVKEDVHVNQR